MLALAVVPSATLLGVDGHPVTVEVHVGDGLPAFTVVGLPDASCREARDRVRAALGSAGIVWPNRKITVNLAPSMLQKVGSGLDLADRRRPPRRRRARPDGSGRRPGLRRRARPRRLGPSGPRHRLAGRRALDARRGRAPRPAPPRRRWSAATTSAPWATVTELVQALLGDADWPDHPPPADRAGDVPAARPRRRARPARGALRPRGGGGRRPPPAPGRTAGRGQDDARPPLPGLLPPLEAAEALQATRVHSAAGLALPPGGLVRRPPFRAPHHGASAVSLVGGGSGAMRPGEISTAHAGVLFLDELGEFHTDVLDALRQPLEEGVVRVARAAATVTFPARFLLVAAMNPCPCGDGGRPAAAAAPTRPAPATPAGSPGRCSTGFDLRVEVSRPDVGDLLGGSRGEPTAVVAERVAAARASCRRARRGRQRRPPAAPCSTTGAPRPGRHRPPRGGAPHRPAQRPGPARVSARSPAPSPTSKAHEAPLRAEHVAWR